MQQPRRYQRIRLTSIHLGDADALSGREDQTIRLWKQVTQRGARGTLLTIFDKQPHAANRGRISKRFRKTRPRAKRAVNGLKHGRAIALENDASPQDGQFGTVGELLVTHEGIGKAIERDVHTRSIPIQPEVPVRRRPSLPPGADVSWGSTVAWPAAPRARDQTRWGAACPP